MTQMADVQQRILAECSKKRQAITTYTCFHTLSTDAVWAAGTLDEPSMQHVKRNNNIQFRQNLYGSIVEVLRGM